MRTLVWFRGKDLRLADHAPLHAAIADGEVIPLFVLDPYFFAPDRATKLPHRMQFLLESLSELAAGLKRLGSRLIVVSGRSVDLLPKLVKRWNVDRVVAHRWVEPFARERDRRIMGALDVPFDCFEGETLHPPGTLRTGSGTPYSVFTPFARLFQTTATIQRPLPAPSSMAPPPTIEVEEVPIPTPADLGLEPNSAVIRGGEQAAIARLRAFLPDGAADYVDHRDQMALEGTSRLSADLKFGTLSARTIWTEVQDALGSAGSQHPFLRQLVWREFAHSSLYDRPELLKHPFRAAFEGFPWRNDEGDFQAWREGKTGYPIVDAAARQLLAEGFVHNRARMVAASFLCKHLLVDYRLGEAHYMRYLVDGDWAQNNMGWQWSAGCGCDAQPYFRVFNPMTQGKKFDSHGAYVRRWVPELAGLSSRSIHAPWEAKPLELAEAGVRLGDNYPLPIIDHPEARQRFLALSSSHIKGTG